MNIALITKNKKQINLKLLDEQLKELIEEEFQDVYTLNFFLQTIPKKYNTIKTLIVYNDLDKLNYNTDGIDNNKNHKDNTLKLILAEEENSYFINEFD
ncbi:MAG: hypothetical protein ACTHJ7_06790 [Candidatus Nitrosocosmicus sp.]|jgi:hypothetical protein|nr:hypothetical protein [Candidatus Nitrosocosmicus sp.]